MKAVIIGGSSGLGLELAKRLVVEGADVVVTGRTDPKAKDIRFVTLDLAAPVLPKRLEEFVKSLPKVDLLVYAAGYYQEGRVTDLSEEHIEEMLDVGARGLIYAVRAVLNRQERLKNLVVITSSSQWTPRKLEPIYNFVKAGEGHFANAMAEDGRIDKVLVDGQFGMQTGFWRGRKHPDWDKMLDPKWVAEQIIEQLKPDYRYRFIKIHRDPPKVEVVETR